MSASSSFSLRRRLLVYVLGGATLYWLTTSAFSFLDARQEIDELFDAQLAQTAQTLLAIAMRYDREGSKGDEGDAEAFRPAHEYQKQLKFRLWRKDGVLVARSANAPKAAPAGIAEGFSESSEPDGRWRHFAQCDARGISCALVSEQRRARDELAFFIAGRLIGPAVIGLPVLGVLVWLAIYRGLVPLSDVAARIERRRPEDLEPLVLARTPAEIHPLLRALNGLLGRVGRTIEAERRLTADAAHELRTPLAAMAAQAHVAAHSRENAERAHALAQLSAGIRRAARLVEQLLTAARLDHEPADGRMPAVRLDRLVEESCARHGAEALAKRIGLQLDAEPVEVRGQSEMLGILLRNLLDNAIRYTPPGGDVRLRVEPESGGAVLSVTDTGPGIAPQMRERVFARFCRLAGQDIEGSGLGLSIVARIAELHGARVSLGDAPSGSGLCVSVRFPFGETIRRAA